MAINLSQIRDQLLPGLRGINGQYPLIPTQWSTVFDRGESKMAIERTLEDRYLGAAAIKNEGAATMFDNAAGERYVYNQEHLEFGLGYAITRKAIDDNLYKDKFNPSNLGLMNSFAQTKEITGAGVLNTGFTYNTQVGGDGVAMIASNHPIDGGTYSNIATVPVDLNETSIESALIQIRQFPDQAGLKIFARGRKLIVPIQLQYVAERMLKSELRPNTANNDVNPILTSGALPEGYQAMDYLTSPTYWFIRTNIPGLLYLDRVPFETDMQVDPVTGNLLVIGYERYSFSYNNPRAIWGSNPST